MNKIIIKEHCAEIVLNNHDKNALIDVEDIDKIKNFHWYFLKNNCPQTCTKDRKHFLLSRIIMGIIDEKILVDHKFGNLLDNRKIKLRTATKSQNAVNSKLRKNNVSGYCGISWDKLRKKWKSTIKVNYKQIFLGRFLNIKEAIKAREKAENKYYKGWILQR